MRSAILEAPSPLQWWRGGPTPTSFKHADFNAIQREFVDSHNKKALKTDISQNYSVSNVLNSPIIVVMNQKALQDKSSLKGDWNKDFKQKKEAIFINKQTKERPKQGFQAEINRSKIDQQRSHPHSQLSYPPTSHLPPPSLSPSHFPSLLMLERRRKKEKFTAHNQSSFFQAFKGRSNTKILQSTKKGWSLTSFSLYH